MGVKRKTRVVWLALAVAIVVTGVTTLVARHLRRQAAQRASALELVQQAIQRAERDQRTRELKMGLDRHAQVMVEARAFEAWLRDVRPKVLAGKAGTALREVDCGGDKQARNSLATCSAAHFPDGGKGRIRYELLWYRSHPEDMRATASGVSYSPLLNCEALGLRQKKRFTVSKGHTMLHCEIADTSESYGVRLAAHGSSKETAISWYSAHYLDRDMQARRELRVEEP